jgi:hypothetical protein
LMLTARHLDLGGFRRRADSDNSQIKTSEVSAGREWHAWLITGGLLIVLIAIIAGWWYLRNAQLYGEPFGLDTMVAIAGPRTTPQTIGQLIAEFDGFRYSYWALFGAVNILTIPIAYTVFDTFTLIALIGLIVWIVINRRRKQTAPLLWLLSYALLVFVGVIRWTMMTPASQGRLMFPAITVISLGLWLGWETILGLIPPLPSWSKWAMPAFMLPIAIVAPVHDIAPTYAGPTMITAADVPSDLKPMNVSYGQEMRLLGYQVQTPSSGDGSAHFTLYWQCLEQPTADYSVFVIAYGRNLSEIGKRDAFPYHGLFATRQCEPGQVFADPYRLRLAADAVRPTVVRIQIGLKDWVRRLELAPSGAGQPVKAVIFAGGKLGPPPQLDRQPIVPVQYRLGEAIELIGYDPPQIDRSVNVLRYRLYWRAAGAPAEDYTVFAHLLDGTGKQIGQGDSQPYQGDYPTSWWQAGEVMSEERVIELGPANDGDWQLALGLYRLADLSRLPIVDSAGRPQADNQIILPDRLHIQP